MKASYLFEDRGTDGQTDGIDFGMYSQKTFSMIYDTPTKAENVWATRKTVYLSCNTRGEA